MRKNVFLLLMLCFSLPVFAETRLLHSYPNVGVYYYYVSDMDAANFKKPQAVKPNDDKTYTIFIYNTPIKAETFKKSGEFAIKNSLSDILPMLVVGLDAKPTYYLERTENQSGVTEVSLCELNQATKYQTKYALNPETGKFEKQVTFNNGDFGIANTCNPNYMPWDDV